MGRSRNFLSLWNDKSHWKRSEEGVEWTITIPANTMAEIRLPGEGEKASCFFNLKEKVLKK